MHSAIYARGVCLSVTKWHCIGKAKWIKLVLGKQATLVIVSQLNSGISKRKDNPPPPPEP